MQGLGSYARFRVSGTTDQPALLTLDGLKDLEANTKIVHFSGSRKVSKHWHLRIALSLMHFLCQFISKEHGRSLDGHQAGPDS